MRQAVMSYARLAIEGPSIIHIMKEVYRKVSEDWHRFLGFSLLIEKEREEEVLMGKIHPRRVGVIE